MCLYPSESQAGGGGDGANDSTLPRRSAPAGNRSTQAYQPDADEDLLLQEALRLSRLEATRAGIPAVDPNEDEAAAQMRRQRHEEEQRERTRLLEEQAHEYQESLRIDQERAAQKALREKEEAEQRKQEEDARQARALEEAAAERSRLESIESLIAEARRGLDAEPGDNEADRVEVQVRLPDNRRIKRRFSANAKLCQVYFFVTVEGPEVLAEKGFVLVSPMPRRALSDREVALETLGLKGQVLLHAELLDN